MTAAVLFAVRKPQPDLDPQELLPDDPVIWHRALEGLKPGTRISQKKNGAHNLFGYRVGTPLAGGSTGLRW